MTSSTLTWKKSIAGTPVWFHISESSRRRLRRKMGRKGVRKFLGTAFDQDVACRLNQPIMMGWVDQVAGLILTGNVLKDAFQHHCYITVDRIDAANPLQAILDAVIHHMSVAS